MNPSPLLQIAQYVMLEVPLIKCDIAFLFGTRHGVEEFCIETYDLWRRGMFKKVLISGGHTAGYRESEAEVIAARLRQLGIPMSDLILENTATNTGQNVTLGLAKLTEVMDISSIRSVLIIGKICSMRRYFMTLERHWPGLRLSCCGVNYFGVPANRWHEHDEFLARVMDEFIKIPRYLRQDFLTEIKGLDPYPKLRDCEALVSAANKEIERRRTDSATPHDDDKRPN
jgi:uncharacterized SAM-binding protein YcdF (DUF218 family)